MKDQYFGDVNDYRKYGLLRLLAGGLRLGVCWMRTPDDGRGDGGRIGYLGAPGRWRAFDQELFDVLRRAVLEGRLRRVEEVARRRLLPGARFAGAVVPVDAAARARWLRDALRQLADSDLVFFDPDNGLEVPSVPHGRRGSDKYLHWDEVEWAWAAGHSLLVYQHFPRVQRAGYTARLLAALRERTGAPVTASFTTSHVVFLLAARRGHAPALRAGAAEVARRWEGEIEVRLVP